jgi:hypothetical protein
MSQLGVACSRVRLWLMLRIATVLLLVACGGSKPASAPISSTPPASEPAPAPAPSSIEAVLVQLRELRDKMCACKDSACGEKVQQELEQWAASLKDPKQPVTVDHQNEALEIGEAHWKCFRKLTETP